MKSINRILSSDWVKWSQCFDDENITYQLWKRPELPLSGRCLDHELVADRLEA